MGIIIPRKTTKFTDFKGKGKKNWTCVWNQRRPTSSRIPSLRRPNDQDDQDEEQGTGSPKHRGPCSQRLLRWCGKSGVLLERTLGGQQPRGGNFKCCSLALARCFPEFHGRQEFRVGHNYLGIPWVFSCLGVFCKLASIGRGISLLLCMFCAFQSTRF